MFGHQLGGTYADREQDRQQELADADREQDRQQDLADDRQQELADADREHDAEQDLADEDGQQDSEQDQTDDEDLKALCSEETPVSLSPLNAFAVTDRQLLFVTFLRNL
jgi:hypothetical protein